MGWNADCYRKLTRHCISIRGMILLGVAFQELNIAPVLFNNMAHDGKPEAAMTLGAPGFI